MNKDRRYKIFGYTALASILLAPNVNATQEDQSELLKPLNQIELEEDVQEETHIYIMPRDTDCTKKNKITYCTDKKGTPITGELISYKNKLVNKRYQMKDGYLDGTSDVYHKNGNLKLSAAYKQGILNGEMIEYEKDGTLLSKTIYSDGKKDGPSTYDTEEISTLLNYKNNLLEGEADIWSKPNSSICVGIQKYLPDFECTKQQNYKLTYENNKLINGEYSYIGFSVCNKEDTDCQKQVELRTIKLSDTVIEGINENCLKLQERLSLSQCPVLPDGKNPKCNREWLSGNQKELNNYLLQCRCPKIHDGTYKKGTDEYTRYKEQCIRQE